MADKIPAEPGLSLADRLRLEIETNGPMSLDDYMRLCLTHPDQGYYKVADPLGKKGDFVTAPEISQMFGEILGGWALSRFYAADRPASFELVELGPGRGTLMADMLRVVAKDPEALAALNLTLLETNPVLKTAQKQALSRFNPRWIEEIHQLSDKKSPVLIVANEFFDALPIKQFQFQNGHWHERKIGTKNKEFVWGLDPAPLPQKLAPSEILHPQEGEIWESCPLAEETIARIADLLNKRGGALLVVDYGYEYTRTGDTFQAVANHKYADPLQNPGAADLSAHVNFGALIKKAQARGALAQFTGTQGQVLKQMGIVERAEMLMASNPDKRTEIKSALERLIARDQMGELFKVMLVQGAPNTTPYERDENLGADPKVIHGFFGRRGGCSTGDFASLNVSVSVKDDPDSVAANRQKIMHTLGLAPDKLATLSQVHSARVLLIDQNHDLTSRPQADGMVTNTPGIGLGVLSADCTPILFADPDAGIIGACHAGWRGAVKGIISNTVEAMKDLGADPVSILAAIGPTIWPDNYEVGPQFAEDFLALHPGGIEYLVTPEGKERIHFDLPGFIQGELQKAGIGQISRVGGCTYAQPHLYFSHRYATHKNTKMGRQISVIALMA